MLVACAVKLQDADVERAALFETAADDDADDDLVFVIVPVLIDV